MNSVGDAFSYPFRDPGWAGKIAVPALILIIPIVGWIAAAGWLVMTYENLREGRQELAPAGFHLERGIGLFGVIVIYSIVLSIPAWILEGIGASVSNQNSILGPQLSGLGSLLSFVAELFIAFLSASLIVLTALHGFSGGLDVQRVWWLATSRMNNSVIG